jgi:branched-chain amino acid transport system substrate-binding protein
VLANGAGDAANALKTAHEFNLDKNQRFLALVFLDTDVHAVGAEMAKGLIVPAPFYRARSAESIAWSKRYFERMKSMPNYTQAGAYSYTMNYLKAVQAAGTDESTAVVAKMKSTPIDDFFAKGYIRKDGKFVFDQYLVEVKPPGEAKESWDYFKLVDAIPAETANPPLAVGVCPFL